MLLHSSPVHCLWHEVFDKNVQKNGKKSHLIALRLCSKASGGMWLPPILWILCGKQKLTSSQLLICSRTTPVVQRLQRTDIPCHMKTNHSMHWHWTDKYNKMSNHTPVVGFLQVSGQLTFGKNLPKRGLRASVTFNEEQKNISISSKTWSWD